MSRFAALLLALLLPLQFAWGAAAGYCGHETVGGHETVVGPETVLGPETPGGHDLAGVQLAAVEVAPSHFGHHEHLHLADDGKPAAAKLAVDHDCGACHATPLAIASHAVAVGAAPMTGRRAISPPFAPLRSALSRAPDRPQWPGLV